MTLLEIDLRLIECKAGICFRGSSGRLRLGLLDTQ